MEKLVRYRKAFYEKENDLQHGNKKRQPVFAHENSLEKAVLTLPTIPPKSPLDNKKEKIKNDTEAYTETYGDLLLNCLEYSEKPNHFLKTHQIDSALRARMLDWMVEVTASYKYTNKTYFDGANLMDRYFKEEKQCLPPTKLHLLGVQCMLIASKMEEVYPLKIRTIYEKIAHRKIPMQQLIETQQKIMIKLDYKLNTWAFFDLVMLKLSLLQSQGKQKRQALGELYFASINHVKQSRQISKEIQLKKMEELSSYLSKFALYDYQFYCQNSMILLSECIVKATLQIMSIAAPINFYSCSPIVIELCKQKLYNIIKSFRNKFHGLNNIFKFTSKDVIGQVDQFLQ